MKATPYLEQVFHLIIRLLNEQGHEQIAEQLAEIYELPQWIEHNNPLFKKGLTKIVKEYVKNNEKILHYYQNRVQNQHNQESNKKSRKESVDSHRKSLSPKAEIKVRKSAKKAESPVISKVASPKRAASPKQANPKASSWMAKFEKPKTLEELNEGIENVQEAAQEEPEVNHSKPKKHKKTKKIESSEYQSQQDSFELEPKKKMKKEAKEEKKIEKKKKKQAKEQSEEVEEEIQEQKVAPAKKVVKPVAKPPAPVNTQKYQPEQNGEANAYPKKFFSRINPDDVGPIRDQLRDNSFQAKAKFGQQADHWGQFGYEKLKDTRGDSFKKTKGKLKNRAFQGALMDINKINSIPIA